MIKIHSGSAVPRYQVFVLGDGTFVIQWTEASVQDLMTGQYREYGVGDFGHRVTDHELDGLKTSGVIEGFDHAYVWLYALPEESRFELHTMEEQAVNRVRSYYVNTTLPAEKLDEVEHYFAALDLAEGFCACEHEGLVAVLGKDALPFTSLKDAENAQRRMQTQLPEMFQNAAVAFTENASDFAPEDGSDEQEFIDLDALIDSQTNTTFTEGKYAVVACKDDTERRLITHLLETMKMQVVGAQTAQEALVLLEEQPVDVLVMDVRFDDMHGWAMLAKLREIDHSDRTQVIALADADAGDQVFALTVAKVDVYLRKPISVARLRQSIWSALKEHSTG